MAVSNGMVAPANCLNYRCNARGAPTLKKKQKQNKTMRAQLLYAASAAHGECQRGYDLESWSTC